VNQDEPLENRIGRIRADAFFVPTDDGVRLRNDRGSLVVGGRSAYPLVKWLFSALDGRRTVGEIWQGIESARRSPVEALIRTLANNGFLRWVAEPLEIPPWADALYGDYIAFVDEHVDAAMDRFMHFRTRRLACIGDGSLLSGAVTALLEAGASAVDVFARSGDPQELTALRLLADRAIERDPDLNVNLKTIPQGAIREGAKGAIGAADCVLFCSDRGTFEEAGALHALAAEGGCPFGAVLTAGDVVVASPLSVPEAGPCWECAYRSIYLPGPSPSRGGSVAPAPAALGSFSEVLRVFCHYTGIPHELPAQCTLVNPRTLAADVHRVLWHPLCSRHGASFSVADASPLPLGSGPPTRADLPGPDDPAASLAEQDAIATATARWTDAFTGPLIKIGEEELGQIPLAASRCVLRAPLSRLDDPAAQAFVVHGLSARETRNQAVLVGLEWLAGEVAQLRGTPLAWHCEAPAAELTGVTWAGVGWSADEAVYRALEHASRCWAKATLGISEGDRHMGDLSDSETGRYLLGLLADRNIGGLRILTDLAPTGFFVAAGHAEGAGYGYGCGVTTEQAGLNALLDLCSGTVGQANVPGSGGPGATEVQGTAHLTDGLATLVGALDVAESRRTARGVRASVRDGSSLLPFAGDAVVVATLAFAYA